MNKESLKKIASDAEIKLNKVNKLINDRLSVQQSIEDVRYMKAHAGEMFFTGNSGKIGERDVYLKKIKLNTIAGCVAIPDLILSLAEKKLRNIEIEENEMLEGEK